MQQVDDTLIDEIVRKDGTRGKWDRPHIVDLIRLWDNGWSAGAIADHFGGIPKGYTRNAVVGKVYRLRQIGIPMTARTRNEVKRRPMKQRRLKEQIVVSQTFIPKKIVVPLNERRNVQTVLNNQCRWLFGDPKDPNCYFCNEPQANGISFCQTHAKRAYTQQIFRGYRI